MTEPLLICTDLDRTLLPNGPQPESPGARELFARLVRRAEVSLSYVSGRHLALVEQAMAEYALPVPDYLIGDVGTSIYRRTDRGWELLEGWGERLGEDWHDLDGPRLQPLLADLKELRLQEDEKQGRFKLSYYLPAGNDAGPLLEEVRGRLAGGGVRTRLVWSVDETVPVGLLDILPARAGKLAAIEFLLGHVGLDERQVLFAGDSGNDLPVLASRIPAVLVANATEEVRVDAVRLARQENHRASLYLARGGYRGLNGNYSAGILEGAAHYYPRVERWLAEDAR